MVEISGVIVKPKLIAEKAVALSEFQFAGVAMEERSSSGVPVVTEEEL